MNLYPKKGEEKRKIEPNSGLQDLAALKHVQLISSR